jgi:hypothetical protein
VGDEESALRGSAQAALRRAGLLDWPGEPG